MQILFWLSTLLILYIYLGYPILLRFLPKKPIEKSEGGFELPFVTVLIPAFNESKVIRGTIENKLQQHYPSHLLEIIVISDESEDGTDEIVQEISRADSRVKLVRQSPRKGKTSGLNLAVPQAQGEIIVFSDANSHYHPNAIRELVACFSDPDVGYATGKMVYVNEEGNVIGDGCSAYMRYENYLRSLETEVSSVVGVDGGVDAIRKSIFQPMNQDQLPDFVQPLKVVTQGKRVVYCETALLNEESLSTSQSEFRMRVRVSLRAYWAMWDMKHLFNFSNFGLFSLQLISHKLLRYLAFLPLVIAFICSGLITGDGWVYQVAFLIQIVFYGAAGYVSLNDGTNNKFLALANYFCLINLASAMAFLKFIKGEKIVMWKPRVG